MENSRYTNANFEYIAYDTVNQEYCTVENFNNLKKSIYPHMLRISLDFNSNMDYPFAAFLNSNARSASVRSNIEINKFNIATTSGKAHSSFGIDYKPPITMSFLGSLLKIRYLSKESIEDEWITIQATPKTFKNAHKDMDALDYIKFHAEDKRFHMVDKGDPKEINNFFNTLKKDFPKDDIAFRLMEHIYYNEELGNKSSFYYKSYFD